MPAALPALPMLTVGVRGLSSLFGSGARLCDNVFNWRARCPTSVLRLVWAAKKSGQAFEKIGGGGSPAKLVSKALTGNFLNIRAQNRLPTGLSRLATGNSIVIPSGLNDHPGTFLLFRITGRLSGITDDASGISGRFEPQIRCQRRIAHDVVSGSI